uniref:Uncharacterized protein n=1 Tax=Fundulus heteroclitus TaxID=8078 RepID=A0A3Q2PTU4_FUNHE
LFTGCLKAFQSYFFQSCLVHVIGPHLSPPLSITPRTNLRLFFFFFCVWSEGSSSCHFGPDTQATPRKRKGGGLTLYGASGRILLATHVLFGLCVFVRWVIWSEAEVGFLAVSLALLQHCVSQLQHETRNLLAVLFWITPSFSASLAHLYFLFFFFLLFPSFVEICILLQKV